MKNLKLAIAIVCFGLIGFTANAQDKDKVNQTIEHTQKTIEAESTESKVYLIQAMSYLQKNDVAKAQELLLKTAEVAKATGNKADEATANEYLSNMFLKEAVAAQKTKKWGEVLENANKSLTYKESNNGYKLKGAAATALKKWDDVIAAYTALLSDAKEAGGANYNLGMAYLGKGNTAKACEHFKKVGNDPNYKVPAEQQLKTIKCS